MNDVSVFAKVHPLMGGDGNGPLTPHIFLEEVDSVTTSHYSSSLIMQKSCWISLQYSSVVPQTLQCYAGG